MKNQQTHLSEASVPVGETMNMQKKNEDYSYYISVKKPSTCVSPWIEIDYFPQFF